MSGEGVAALEGWDGEGDGAEGWNWGVGGVVWVVAEGVKAWWVVQRLLISWGCWG